MRPLPTNVPCKKIVVIGAGFAGLSAARSLVRHSGCRVDVKVLEATERVGGRAHTVQLPVAGPVSLGATWFHGTKGHPAVALALEKGLLTKEEVEQRGASETRVVEQWDLQLFEPGGEEPLAGREQELALKGLREYWEVIRSIGGSSLTEISDEPHHTPERDGKDDTEESGQANDLVLGDLLRRHMDEVLRDGALTGKDLCRYVSGWAWSERLQRAFDGNHSTDVAAAAGLMAYEDLEGPNLPVPGGYQYLASLLVEDLPISFSACVKGIIWGEEGLPQSSNPLDPAEGQGNLLRSDNEDQQPVKVVLSSGEVMAADAVICTVSLGVLKAKHQELFQPPLPARKTEAIKKLSIGVVDKVFVEMPDLQGSAKEPLELLGRGPQSCEVSGTAYTPGNRVSQQTIAPQTMSAFLWPSDPQLLGTRGPRYPLEDVYTSGPRQAAAGVDVLAHGVSARLLGRELAGGGTGSGALGCCPEDMPSWLRAVNGFRYGPGPEWVEPPARATGDRKEDIVLDLQRGLSDPSCSAVIWLAGDKALHAEQLPEDVLEEDVRSLLELYPGAFSGRSRTDSLRVYMSRWGTDPHFLGSYSYLGKGATVGDVEALAAPLQDEKGAPLVCFAGEACDATYIGTVHGAMMSGQKAALHLLEHYDSLRP